jgi:hypothetical protein
MKKKILIVSAMSLFLLILASCSSGIPQTEYDKVKSDMQALQDQYNSLQTSTQSLQAEKTKVQNDLNNQLDAGKKQVADLNSQLATAKNENQAIQALLNIGANNAVSKEAILSEPEKYASTFYPAASETLVGQYSADALDKVKSVFGDAKDGTPSTNKNISDQYDRAIYLWYNLNSKHLNSIIVLGNLKDEKATFEKSEEVWLRIYGPNPKNIKQYVINANTLNFINFTNADDKPIPESAVYKDNRGYWYTNAEDFKKDISYRWK